MKPRRGGAVALVAAAGVAIAAVGVPTLAGADSYTPVVFTIKIAATGHLKSKLPITVGVRADPDVLDIRTAPLRVEVKLATECGGTFAYTPGVTLLNKPLNPQPSVGKAYSGKLSSSATPITRGVQTVCVWLAEEGDQRVFGSDQSTTVNVLNALPRKHVPKQKTKKGTHHR